MVQPKKITSPIYWPPKLVSDTVIQAVGRECMPFRGSKQPLVVVGAALRLLAAHPEPHHLLVENILEGKEEGRR